MINNNCHTKPKRTGVKHNACNICLKPTSKRRQLSSKLTSNRWSTEHCSVTLRLVGNTQRGRMRVKAKAIMITFHQSLSVLLFTTLKSPSVVIANSFRLSVLPNVTANHGSGRPISLRPPVISPAYTLINYMPIVNLKRRAGNANVVRKYY